MIIAFVAFAFLRILFDSFLREWMVFSGGAFDRYGRSWIILKGIFYGSIGILLYLTIAMMQFHSLYAANTAIFIGLLLYLDCFLVHELQNSAVDVAIQKLGYLISRITPYKANDTVLEEKTPLPPNTSVSFISKQGRVSLQSGRGTLRSFRWNGKERCIEVSRTSIHGNTVWRFPQKWTGEDWPGYCWKDNSGIKRCFYYETSLYFERISLFHKWLELFRNDDETLIVSREGYVIWSSFTSNPEALTLWFHKVTIEGQVEMPQDCLMGECKISNAFF